MRVVDRLAQRVETWRELDEMLARLEARRRGPSTPEEVLRLGELYRSACADLMLAEAHDLPADAVAFLHALVGRAHNAVYRVKGPRLADFAEAVFVTAPRRLRHDPALRIAAAVFWGLFLLCGLLAAGRPGFATRVIGEDALEKVEAMYDHPIGEADTDGPRRSDAKMAGFYIWNNAGIGLRCFAWGLALGLGSLLVLVQNAVQLGSIFGHMARSPQAPNFFTFVTAHGPFELTAVVFSAAAGLRLGWGLVDTRGQTRVGSLRREAHAVLPTVGAAVTLFILAAFLEGFVSASPMPYAAKAAIALLSATALIAYLALGGRSVERLEANDRLT